jgi:hypothetical protein
MKLFLAMYYGRLCGHGIINNQKNIGMKNKIIVLLSILCVSCDPSGYMDLYIQNNCNQPIIIRTVTSGYYGNIQTFIDTINPHTQSFIYQCESIGSFSVRAIPVYLQEMHIEKEGKTIIYNPLDTNRWIFKEMTPYKLFKSKYHSKATLTITPEDFE